MEINKCNLQDAKNQNLTRPLIKKNTDVLFPSS